jgi:hypothetical protein
LLSRQQQLLTDRQKDRQTSGYSCHTDTNRQTSGYSGHTDTDRQTDKPAGTAVTQILTDKQISGYSGHTDTDRQTGRQTSEDSDHTDIMTDRQTKQRVQRSHK